MTGLDQKIEILTINDLPPPSEKPTEPIVPHERQVVDSVIQIWKEDAETESLGIGKLHQLVRSRNPDWALSEKRLKTLLNSFGLLTTSNQFTYVGEIKSEFTPNLILPDKVRLQMTKARGKGLYATRNIAKGTILWEEEQLFFIPPLANVNLMKHGSACAYCGRSLLARASKQGKQVLGGLDCNVCSEMWCSTACKKRDSLHKILKHSVYNPNSKQATRIVDTSSFEKLEEFCLKEQWNALYAVTMIYATVLADKTNQKKEQFNAMAKVSQEVRYKAQDSSAGTFDSSNGGALFVQEQQELLWEQGYKLFSNVFPHNPITYKEFMMNIGSYNINNIDSSMFLLQSHLNHNCDPNTETEFGLNKADGIKIIAKRDIKSGEELTSTYVNPAYAVNKRKRELRVNWGFLCACNKCKADEKLQQRRKSSAGSIQKDQKEAIKEMLKKSEAEHGGEIELTIPEVDLDRPRRKSVRFDEIVVAVKE